MGVDPTRGLLQTPSFHPISPGQQVSLESGGLDLPQKSAAKVFRTKGACLEEGADRGSSEVQRWQKSQRLPRASPCCACLCPRATGVARGKSGQDRG